MKTNGPTEVTPQAGAVVRQNFDSTQMEVSADVGSAALAAQAEAEVKARWAIAQRNPRDWDEVRAKLLKECKRPMFAATARYAKPIGGSKVYGPSIRFVEVALRCMGNVYCPVTVISDTPSERRIQVMVTDLETNISWPRQITIQKTVERSDAKGRQVLSERKNSYGKTTYTVVATEDELANKEAAAISKAIRQSGLRVIPGDLQDEAMALCIEVQGQSDAKDPDGARKRLIDAFGELGITPAMLKEYIGHAIDHLQPAELQDLREIYAAIRDGESKWADVMDLKRAGPETVAPPQPTASKPAEDPKKVVTEAPAPTPAPAPASAPGFAQVEIHADQPKAAPAPANGPPLTPVEQDIERGLAEAKKTADVMKVLKLMNQVPEVRKATWRDRFNARMEELANAPS